jgi:hydroxymethylglutaryl-CoA synthase
MTKHALGISGFSAFFPPYRVSLERWCEWTGNSWDKTRAVIGSAFRVAGAEQSVYTMAANAALKLILDYGVDPRRVGYIAVGTESGTDNATSAAVVVRGLVDQALRARGMPALARDCEAPEIKQACLGGVYGIKAALRFLALDGEDRVAIVVAADIAEYERGSTGEPTQGAGAVAMLLERDPKLLEIDLCRAGSASSYRALDFRKPFLRFCGQTPGRDGRPRDFPVFNGKYSTACYIDEVISALEAMLAKRSTGRANYFREVEAVFMHRPYHRMPVASWTMGYLFALGADGGREHEELKQYCAKAGLELDTVLAEMRSSPDLIGRALGGELVDEPYPLTALLMKVFKDTAAYKQIVDGKMKLGSATMMELGNLYSAALPAWLAVGLEEAAATGCKLDGRDLLIVGYGSGDAAEALPARVVSGWSENARKYRVEAALEGAVELNQAQYEALHDGREAPELQVSERGFVIRRIGLRNDPKFQDFGVEYYEHVG